MTHSFPTRRSSDLFLAHADETAECQQLDGKVLRRSERQREVSHDRCQESQDDDGEEGADERRGESSRQRLAGAPLLRSEEHTSELQSLMRISYAVFCLKTKHKTHTHKTRQQ